MMSKNGTATADVNVDITLGRLKKLSKSERILVGLYFYERLSIEEIALVLQKSNQSIQEKLNQIYCKLLNEPVSEQSLNLASQEVVR
ncbi:MAG: hypothetical protein D6748_02390 [Calditrichaeota bacterium]|nr:MAG: hypothetical protein D6748_02390 [Calditrichota bacterium]